MKFVVSRTSQGSGCPCEEAELMKIKRVETRTLRTPEEFDAKFSLREGKWLEVGSNHRINKEGYITQDNGKISVYGVSISSLSDLIKFAEKYGDLVIQKCMWNNEKYEIEIYDDYRE